MAKVRVLIVDDSAVVRSVLSELLSMDPGIEVVGEAEDPYVARDKIKALRPDVLTLDIEMPRMDGLTFLKNLMRLNPMPVVMLSSLTNEGADETLQALELGAVDFISKPTVSASDAALEHFQRDLTGKVKAAAATAAKLKFRRPAAAVTTAKVQSVKPLVFSQHALVTIGASTGGTEALRELICNLPGGMPPIVVTQHIPETFSTRFAKRLNDLAALTVKEPTENEVLKPGHVYVAPGSHHLQIKKRGDQLYCHLSDADRVNRHKPSVEVMFNSLLNIYPEQVVAVMLTGMGEDGAKAMKALADAGARTLIQDEATSMVWGMPGAAYRYGASKELVALDKIADRLVRLFSR
ncbi:protein-glutamate methylesterase/protein-glutamine glutaminase [Pontibacter sp. JAM-7]|uniref:protein-glutamate methylesterase/protein-glutamine glutaminase n=1 Tax=Pontibacter sp. JAM-7 TaxID=3366581 RepID=UPI003AF65C5C